MALPTTVAEIRAKQLPQGAVDPNVKIPKSVLEAGQRSEAIQRAVAGEAEPSVAAQVEGQVENGAQNPPDGSQPPVQVENQPVQPPPAEPPVAPPLEDEASWERKFKSLQGRHDADQRRANDMITQLSNRLDQMERENNLLRTGPPAGQPNGHAAPPSLSEQEIADYGPEFVDVMRRVAAETAGPLQAEIQNLRGQLGHVQQETGNAFLARMNTSIASVVPNWAELNKHPSFVQWSQLPDIFSGAIRKTLMQDAWNAGDPYRVAAFFQAFLAEEAATNPPGQVQPRTPPPSRLVVSDTPDNPLTPGAPLDLTSLAAPGRAHSAGGAPAEKPVYTAAEITRFYTDVSQGRWRGREQQQQAIDRDIILAQREGRIIPNPRSQLPRDQFTR